MYRKERLRKQRHKEQENEEIKETEERKYCSKCRSMQKIENLKKVTRLATYAEKKEQRRYQRHKDRLNEQNKEYKANNPEKVKEWRQNRFNRIKDEIVTCPVCKCDIKKYKQAQHEKSQTHQYYLQRPNDPDFEKDVPRPGKIRVVDGKELYFCKSCRSEWIPCIWSRPLSKPPHLQQVTA